MIGEERRIEEKRALFFCLDCENGQELWQQAPPGDEWWIGVEAVYRDTVFFHGFANPNLPLHRGIIVADVLTGKKLWEDLELEFIGIRDDFVIGSRETSSGRSFLELERRSGAKRGELNPAELRALDVRRPGLEVEIKPPLPIEQLAAGDPRIETVIKNHLGSVAVAGLVEAVELEKFYIFDYHELSGRSTVQDPRYSSAIKIIERATGAVVYSDTVSTGMKTVTPELFFVLHDTLYYIQERQTVIAVRLAS